MTRANKPETIRVMAKRLLEDQPRWSYTEIAEALCAPERPVTPGVVCFYAYQLGLKRDSRNLPAEIDDHRDRIVEMILSTTFAYAVIGRELGVSRERVRQIAEQVLPTK